MRLLRDHGVRYVEWWSMDERSQGWYESYGMRCIDRHWRFTVKPDEKVDGVLREHGVTMVNAHLTCSPEDWPGVQQKLRIITKPPLEPCLCRGFAHEF